MTSPSLSRSIIRTDLMKQQRDQTFQKSKNVQMSCIRVGSVVEPNRRESMTFLDLNRPISDGNS